MTQIIMPRRRFLTGLVGLVAAPMVVKASALMPVKSFGAQWNLATREGAQAYFAELAKPRPDDMMFSSFSVETGLPWPKKWRTTIHHRADLSDLGEPYLSQAKAHQAFMREVWPL